MSFDITAWMNELIARLQNAFGSRLTAVGLQGSFKRGDYHAQSDIDAVVILNKLTPADMADYKAVLSQMPASSHPVCGFLGGQDDLKNWSRAELFQFGQDTRWLYGTADGLLPPPTRGDARLAAQSGAGTVYHALVHTWVHGQLTAELIKKDKAIEHWKRIAENAKAKGDGYLNEKIILEEKLRKINAGENPSDRVRELEEENSYLRQAIAKAQIELARLSEKLPSHWERPDDFKFPKFPEHWWVSAPTAGGTD